MRNRSTESKAAVISMIDRRADFGSIEARIESCPLEEDAKAALWLLAWVESPRPRQRQEASEAVALSMPPQG